MAKLSEILKTKQGVDLEFVDMIQDETRDGLPIVRLVLKNPIPSVFGRKITDNVSGDQVRLEANDVESVSIGKDTLDVIEAMEEKGEKIFEWTTEGKSGRIKCDLQFDVSRSLEVWITATKFGKFAADRRNERQQKQNSALVTQLRANRTKREFENVDTSGANANTGTGDGKPKPEVVSGN